MDRTSISRRIGSIKGDIEKLSNTLCAIEKTDIENYPENYAMLTTDAALRSELIACRMRHLLYGSTTTRKETYLASAGVVQGIRIQAQENMLEITLPCLLPKRKQRQSTEFLIDPLYFTLSQYSDNNELPKFRQCVVCFSHIYSEKFHNRRVRDYDNLELKQLLDVLSAFIMVDDTGLLVDAGVLGVVELKLIDKNKKIAAAAYEYKAVHRYANDDDEWGEIRFDFSAGTAQIVKLADGDLSRTNVFAKIAIRQILKLSMSELPKKLTIPFELEQEKIRYGS